MFLKLGMIGFGGPAAHIALMEREIVRRKQWLSSDEFLDLLGASNLIPGPNSTEMAIHIGRRKAGWPGLFVAGSCFILPAAVIVLLAAWAYVRFQSLPGGSAILYGVKPAIIAIIVEALYRLSRAAVKNAQLAAIALATLFFNLAGVNEIALLFGAGFLVAIVRWLPGRGDRPLVFVFAPVASFAAAAVAVVPFSLFALFLFFLKTGSVIFGSGYVLIAFLRADLVERWHWLTESQLLDAIAVGQVTPGPLFTTATFIGYVLGGTPGAFWATLGIFLPAFFFVAVSTPLLPRLRASLVTAGFLDGVNVAALALMAVVTFQIGRAAWIDLNALAVTLVSSSVLLLFRINALWIVLGGALAGFLLQS